MQAGNRHAVDSAVAVRLLLPAAILGPIPCLALMTSGHSLWLIPAEPAKSSFQDTINRFSSEHGTPAFGPHVTLIAGVKPEGGEAQVVSKAERLALELKAISARVERAACKDLYFQSVSQGMLGGEL